MTIETIRSKLEFFSSALAYLGTIALLAMMLLTAADVVGRYFFNHPVMGAFELTEFLVLILIFSFLAHGQAKKSHVAVDLLYQRLPGRLRAIIGVFNHLLCLVFTIFIAYMGYLRASEIKSFGEASSNLGVVKYPFAYFVVLGCSVLSLEYLRDLVGFFSGKQKGDKS